MTHTPASRPGYCRPQKKGHGAALAEAADNDPIERDACCHLLFDQCIYHRARLVDARA